MVDRTETEVGLAQDQLWKRLYGLEATGESGFEGFLTDVLGEVTGLRFHVVKSGMQSGTDVRSEPCNVVSMGLESKQYERRTRLPLDELLYKVHDAAVADTPVDVWILATTRGIDASYREKLGSVGGKLGIEVIIWDWPGHVAALSDLAVVCASAPEACRSWLDFEDVDVALERIRSHPGFALRASSWRERLRRPEVGYASCREVCWRWLEEAQSSVAKAKSRLGGDHDLGSSEYGVIRRSGIGRQLSAWLEDSNAGIAALVGDEGMGKSWAVLDWCAALRKGGSSEAPLVVYVRPTRVKSEDPRDDIAAAIARQGGKDQEFWRRRLDLWERNGGEGLRILVIVDGLNQNFLMRRWEDWLQPLMEEDVRAMYRVVVSCWRSWWNDRLTGLASLEPAPVEIAVAGFNDEELDAMLAAMKTTRGDFAEPLLGLMRVPRLSRIVMAHRKVLADSGDVTVERVIYEDWKDRLRRQGSEAGLDDRRMKAFIAGLGRELRENVNRAMSRRNIGDILAHDSGKTGQELDVAVDQLTSGGWFRPGDDPDTFKVEADRIAYVLGAALMAELKRIAGSADYEATMAKFLDPLKAHSLGARILRAATTIALVEEDTPRGLRQAVVERWLEERNFGEDDFEALWRLAGLDAELFLAIAESDWLEARADAQRDEVLVKTLANAAAFPKFGEALKRRLTEWLGTVWPDPDDGEDDGHLAEGRAVPGRYRKWAASASSREFGCVRLAEDGGAWDWLGHRAVAVASYLERAPYAAALEAWCLSRALMDRAWQLDEVAWLLRANAKDPDEAAEAVTALIERLERQRDPVCNDAAAIAMKAASHVRRIAGATGDDRSEEGEPPTGADGRLQGDALFKAVREYLAADGWKRRSANSGSRLVNAMIAEGLPVGGREVDLLLRHLPDIATVISPQARRRLAAAFEQELAATVAESGGAPRRRADLRAAALLMRLYDASAAEQGRLLLASPRVDLGREWGPLFRRPDASDLAGLNLAGAPCAGQVLWLEFVGSHLDEELIRSLDALPSLATSADRGVRRRAVATAAWGGHLEAMEQFAGSRYATEAVDDSSEGRAEEYARSRAFLALESAQSDMRGKIHAAAECAALRVKLMLDENEMPPDGVLADFARFLERELDAMKRATTWGMARYWFGYRDCVVLLIARRGTEALEEWLAAWAAEPGHFRVECAFMNKFPLQDAVRALQDHAPEVSLRLYETLRTASKRGLSLFSSDAIEDLPFEMPRSRTSDGVCSERLCSAKTDKELLDVAYFCHKHGRVDWLVERIAHLEASPHPGDVARGLTLLGFCDDGPEADSLWTELASREPEDPWLATVYRESRKEYIRNRKARSALEKFWRTDDDGSARRAWKQVEAKGDVRLHLWLEEVDPPWDSARYARRLARSLGTQGVNNAVKKDSDTRKRLLFHTRIGAPDMAPWGE